MSTLINLLNNAMMCMTVLGIAFMILLAMPQSKLREVVKNGLLAIAKVI